jgi:AraC family transcriptional regulator
VLSDGSAAAAELCAFWRTAAAQRIPGCDGCRMIEAWAGLPLGTCRCEGSGRSGPHSVAVDTVLVWSGGTSLVDIECGGRGYSVQRHTGMVDFLPAGVVLEEVRWRGQPTDCIAVMLPPAQVEAMGLSRPQLDPARCLRLGLTDAHVVDLARRLHARAAERDASDAPYVRGLSLTLASYVYSHLATERRSSPPPGPGLTAPQRQRLVARIEARLAEPISVSELALEVGYSQDHFLRLFGSSFGLSPHRYVVSRRIERAKAMLEDPSRSLVDVACACGFSSQAHFSTSFKLHVGVSPGRYRQHDATQTRVVAGVDALAGEASSVEPTNARTGAKPSGGASSFARIFKKRRGSMEDRSARK